MAYFFADFKVGFVRFFFALDVLAPEFILCLCGAKQVGGKFGAAHVVEDVLAFFQTLSGVDVAGIQTAVKTLIAEILENSVINRVNHACIFGGIGKLDIVLAELVSEEKPFFIFIAEPVILVHLLDFLQAGLHGKIGLAKRDEFFGRVGVLDDEVAGVAGKFDAFDFSLCA